MAKRLAVCIGINEYRNSPGANLEFACDDAQAIANLLKDPDRGQFDTVIELYDSNASRENILAELKGIFLNPSRTSNDLILVYFSGHGYIDNGNNLCLIPHDIEFLDEEVVDVLSTIHVTDFQKLADNSKVRTIILILDACYSGSASKLIGGVKYRDDSNICIVGAARSSQKAWETNELASSSFTSCILRAANLKPTVGEWITLQQVLGFTQIEMEKIEKRQTMEFAGHSIDQNIPFVKNPIFRLDSEEFVHYVKDLCSLKQLDIVQTQPNQSFPNTFIVRESISFGGQADMLVICMDNSQIDISPGDIYQYNKLFQQFRSKDQIDRGIIITRRELPASLKTILAQSMTSMTIDEILRTLIDFKRHLKGIIDEFVKSDPERFGEPPLEKCFVEPDLEVQSTGSEQPIHEPLTKVINDWLASENQPAALILGGYGTGKSTAARKIAYDLASNYETRADKRGLRIPIVFPLRKFPKFSTVDIEAFVVAHLKQACKVINPDFEALKAMNEEGLLLLILDGFDEMAIHASTNIVRRNFREIIQFATSCKAKVLITSRPEAFIDESEESRVYRDFSVATGNNFTLAKFRLLPFSETQIESYLQKRVPLIGLNEDWTYYRDQIDQMIGLKYIVERPILLEITIRTLPQLLLKGNHVTRTRIYETYLLSEFARQMVDKKREFLIESNDTRLHLMEVVACHLYSRGYGGVTVEQLSKLLQPEFPIDQQLELESLVRDYINCSFMIREGDQYLFSHQSFMEFLVAKMASQEVESQKATHLARFRLNSTILEFLADMKPIDDLKWRETLWSWVDKLRFDPNSSKQDRVSVLDDSARKGSIVQGSNAISLLNLMNELSTEADLSNTVLLGAILRGGILHDINFKEAIIRDCNFHGAELYRANFSDTDISGTNFHETVLHDANFEGAIVRDCNFHRTQLNRGELSNTNIDDSNFHSVVLQDANLEGSKLNGCNLHEADLSRANLRNIEWRDVLLNQVIVTDTLLDTPDSKPGSNDAVSKGQSDNDEAGESIVLEQH